jgi:hypothetical protein
MPIQRSIDVIAASNNAANRPEVMQSQYAEHMQRRVDHDGKHVRQSNKSEDSESLNDKKDRRDRRKKEKEAKLNALSSAMSGALFDIRV